MQHQQAVTFYAGPERMMPPDTVCLKFEDAEMEWASYVYRKCFGLSEVGKELLQSMFEP